MYPAGEAGILVRTVTIGGGLAIRVIESGPVDGPVLLLVHGWASNVYSFSEMIPALAAGGYRAVALDLPGFGLSDKPTDPAGYTSEALGSAVLDVAAAMGASSFTIVGHSLGGSLGLRLAVRNAPGLERLVLINSVGLGAIPILLPMKVCSPPIVNSITPALLTRGLVRLILRMAFGTRDRPRERDIDEYWAPTQFDEFAWACRASIHRSTWGRVPETELRGLRIPVLVITGRRDALVLGASKRGRSIPGARHVDIHDGGHIVLQECADRTNSAILDFLGATSDKMRHPRYV